MSCLDAMDHNVLPGYGWLFFFTFGYGSEISNAGGMTAVMMCFAATEVGVLFSGMRSDRMDRRCPNGHAVSPVADFCEECGWRIGAHDDSLKG
jgi:hypothetical protein